MKRYICLIISLCLILSSFSFCFATPTQWDTSDQANLRAIKSLLDSGGTLYNQIYNIATNTNTISNNLNTIKGYLVSHSNSVADLLYDIRSWMSPIYNSITSIPVDNSTIIGALGYYDNSTYYPYLNNMNSLDSRTALEQYPNGITLAYATSDGQFHTFTWAPNLNWRNNFLDIIYNMNNSLLYQNTALQNYLTNGFNYTQTYTNWATLNNATFTPGSSTNGIYSWLSYIQSPVARLSYVLASDERIAAQEAAAAAEQQVVDDFIDPAGDSSATASDFGSISDLSSGYQQNFGSTASVSGIFDIFDSNNFGWFSSETYNQLDTTVAQRGSSFDTPLLDQQLEDISRALGVDYAN